MPRLTRWFVRAALLALVLGLGAGIRALIQGRPPFLDPTAIHLLVVGWLTQMVFGVAFWLFPRYSPTAPRGRTWLGWLTFLTLNGGLGLRLVAEPAPFTSAGRPQLLAAAALLQFIAALGFVLNTWPRIRERP